VARRKLTYPAYRQPSRVTFGTGSVRTLADAQVLERAVLLTSGDSGIRDILVRALESQGIDWTGLRVLTKPAGEPTLESVEAAAEWLRTHDYGTLIAVGGGSVIDWARLALAAARGWLDASTGTVRSPDSNEIVPTLVLVPTTCGSGAEAAAVAVYTLDGKKVPIVLDRFLADRVILDAQFLAAARPAAVASWLSDALSHSIESFVSIVPNGLAKQAAVAALHTVLREHNAADVHCRNERLMEAGYLGGVAASNCSVGVVHAFAHTIARYGVPHGVANAMGLAAGLMVNADTAEMRALLSRSGFDSVDSLAAAIAPITRLALTDSARWGVHESLEDARGRETVIERMLADVCMRTNPRRLDRGGAAEFLDAVQQTVCAV
jgi:alcohol dehydrogenase class IV